jgi:hypothetical protein
MMGVYRVLPCVSIALERGVRRIDIVEFIAICKVLGLEAGEFVKNLERRFADR